jgi:hypothetical protein
MIYTFSQFYYGFKINAEPYNGYLDIDEGTGPIAIQVPTGSYTLDDLAKAIRESLLAQGTLDYVVFADRTNRRITISANLPFSILSFTGVHSGTSIYSLIGFNTLADSASALSHTSIRPAGKCYEPQFKLQSYISPEDFQETNQASVNVASIGTVVEVVNFGLAKFIQMDIKYITNRPSDGRIVKNNKTGLEDARDFLRYITQKNYFEFMPNINDANTYFKILLESSPDYSDGTGYKLKELFDKNLPDIYETGILKLRIVE